MRLTALLSLMACGREITPAMVQAQVDAVRGPLKTAFGRDVLLEGWPTVITVGAVPSHNIGWCSNRADGTIITIATWMNDHNAVHEVLLHEMGHAMGLTHQPDGIMAAEPQGSDPLDPYVAARQLVVRI